MRANSKRLGASVALLLVTTSLSLSGCGTFASVDSAMLELSNGGTWGILTASSQTPTTIDAFAEVIQCPPNAGPNDCWTRARLRSQGPGLATVLGPAAFSALGNAAAAALYCISCRPPEYNYTDNSQINAGNGAGALAPGAVTANGGTNSNTNTATPVQTVTANPNATAAPVQNGAPVNANAEIQPGAVVVTASGGTGQGGTGGNPVANANPQVIGGATTLTASPSATAAPVLTGGTNNAFGGHIASDAVNATAGIGPINANATIEPGAVAVNAAGGAATNTAIANPTLSQDVQANGGIATANPTAYGGNIENPASPPNNVNLTFAPVSTNTVQNSPTITAYGGTASTGPVNQDVQANGGIATANGGEGGEGYGGQGGTGGDGTGYGGKASANPIANGGEGGTGYDGSRKH